MEAVRGAVGGHDRDRRLAVAPVHGHQQVALLGLGGQAGGRTAALDIDNDLIEVVFDNSQLAEGTGFDDVDNLVVSPAGDVIVAEDGDAMRLLVMIPNQPAKILLQITGGGSELAGPAFTPDGSRLIFSNQRGPNLPALPGFPNLPGTGATYELLIPEEFR